MEDAGRAMSTLQVVRSYNHECHNNAVAVEHMERARLELNESYNAFGRELYGKGRVEVERPELVLREHICEIDGKHGRGCKVIDVRSVSSMGNSWTALQEMSCMLCSTSAASNACSSLVRG